jgi:hypothetical protein
MANTQALRDKLQDKLFDTDALAVDVTLKKVSFTQNDYGEDVTSYDSGTTIRGVPYNDNLARLGFREYSVGNEGDLSMAVPFDTDVDTQDIVEYEGISYDVVEIERNPFQGNVVFILTLVRRNTHGE